MWIFVALFLFTIVNEALLVAVTISIAEKKKWISALLSGLIEPIKFVTILFVVDSPNKILSIAIVSIACAISNISVIGLIEYLQKKKEEKECDKSGDKPIVSLISD